jgi:hypothetical protein
VEMDLVWNPDSLSKVLSELSGHRLGVMLREDWKFSADPLRTLTAAGLQVLQHRKTARRSRKVVKSETNAEAAELALDSVVYSLADGEVSHFEIEIEAREIEDYDAVKMISEFLLNLFGSQLLRWTHSKLATGEAVASLLQRGLSEERLDGGHLTRAAYEMIDRCLNEKG